MTVLQIINQELLEVLFSLQFIDEQTQDQGKIELTIQDRPEFGELSSNIALELAAKLGQKPRDIALKIVDALQTSKNILKLEIAGPGFINFFLKPEILVNSSNELSSWLKQTNKTLPSKWTEKKVTVEFTDPNPFKEFHIGHLYSNSVGEAMSRILELGGADVWRVCYQGDVGMHVAKSLWGLIKLLKEDSSTIEVLEARTLNERIKYLGQAYAKGATAYEENDPAKEEIKSINIIIFKTAQKRLQNEYGIEPKVKYGQNFTESEFDQEEIENLYLIGRKWSLEYFETIYQELGTKFKDYFFESEVGELGFQLVQEYLKAGIFKNSQGAVIFPGSEHGLHDRVFINNQGLPTYEAKELGLAPEKYRRRSYDYSFIITGNEINEYFKVLLVALKQIKPELAAKTTHLSHGMLRLKDGKMSSRTGKVLTGEWLINEVKERIAVIIEKSDKNYSDQQKLDIINTVSVGAIKFALLSSAIGKDITFDFDQSLSFSGFSGPYLQYTHARCNSVLTKSELSAQEIAELKLDNPENPEEIQLLKKIIFYEDICHNVINNLAPHTLCNYLYELAQCYNNLYNSLNILSATNAQKHERLALTQAVKSILAHGLSVLGISAPTTM